MSDGPPEQPSSDRLNIIRRQPTGAIPVVADEARTSYIPRARPVVVTPVVAHRASPRAAVATSVLSILSGWATAVIAADLITGWWHTDRLFCVAIAFLTAISAATIIGGQALLLLRRRPGRLLVVVGCVIGLMIFASVFVAGAKLPNVVYPIPALPLSTIALALLPANGRWMRSG